MKEIVKMVGGMAIGSEARKIAKEGIESTDRYQDRKRDANGFLTTVAAECICTGVAALASKAFKDIVDFTSEVVTEYKKLKNAENGTEEVKEEKAE